MVAYQPGMNAVAKKTPKNEVSVKIDADIYRLVRTVAAWKGVNIADYLSEVIAPIVRKDMAKMTEEAKGQ